MGAKPYILSGNSADTVVLNPAFVLSNPDADDASGHEAFRVADNTRDLTWWTTTTTNIARALWINCGVATSHDTVILDRGHNLAGVTITIDSSPDAAAWTTRATCTIPAAAGGLGSDANGCLTPEGVWWKTFTSASVRYWRILVPALGAGVAPIITGWYMGVGYRFPEYVDAPFSGDYAGDVVYAKNVLTRGGMRVKTRPLVMPNLAFAVETDAADFPALHTQVSRLLQYNHPWWVCVDDSDATGAGLMRLFQTRGDVSYRPVVDPVHRRVELELEGVMPSLVL